MQQKEIKILYHAPTCRPASEADNNLSTAVSFVFNPAVSCLCCQTVLAMSLSAAVSRRSKSARMMQQPQQQQAGMGMMPMGMMPMGGMGMMGNMMGGMHPQMFMNPQMMMQPMMGGGVGLQQPGPMQQPMQAQMMGMQQPMMGMQQPMLGPSGVRQQQAMAPEQMV